MDATLPNESKHSKDYFAASSSLRSTTPPSSFTKTIRNHSLVERLDPLSMVVLLKIEGNCSCLRAKVAHMVGHLPSGADTSAHMNKSLLAQALCRAGPISY